MPHSGPGRTPGLPALLALLSLLAVLVPGGAAAAAGSGVRQRALQVDVGAEPGGAPVRLDAAVFTPAGAGAGRRWPAVLLAHGFGGSKASVADQARELAGDGYVVLTWTARGFGASGGSVHLDSPDFEVADARALVDLLAARDDVVRDGPGDPRVGVAGASYGGALGLLLAGTDPRVDAVAAAITWNDLAASLVPQSALGAAAGTEGVYKSGWAARLTASIPAAPAPGTGTGAAGAGAGAAACGRLAADLCAAYVATAQSGRADPALRALLAASSPARVLGSARAPTLLVQGEGDSLFGLQESLANARALRSAGAPVKLAWVPGGHDGGLDETDLRARTRAWFDRYLRRDGTPADTLFEFSVPGAGFTAVPQQRELPAPPGSGREGTTASSTRQLALRPVPGAPAVQPVVSPPGGQPAALTSLPGLGGLGALSGLAAAAGSGGGAGGGSGSSGSSGGAGGSGASSSPAAAGTASLSVLPGQAALFQTAPLARDLTVLGASEVSLAVTSSAPDAVLFASLQDVDARGAATLPSGLVAPLRVAVPPGAPGTPVRVRVRLPGVVRDVPAGHRLRLVVASTDSAFAVPVDARTYRVGLVPGAVLAVPVAPASARSVGAGTAVPVPQAVVAGAVVLAAAVLALVAALRRRRAAARTGRDRDDRDVTVTPRAEQRSAEQDGADPGAPTGAGDVVLEVQDLSKVYGDGFRAVDHASFAVRRGQVVGLLGPNGAGKTTTLRMLMGLLRPTSGALRVLGEPVVPGAAVLARVGALVEGPGFLPHLSGADNLRLYWAATGRPETEAHEAEALEVAGLGDAVHRRVRSYSQGMRQRLGIAQAMLGLPDLLVLDEPTNGLDPPQITAMREVLRAYAATGRTVLVSSHLLSEVEQTCTHAVVMARGRVLATGTVADLAGGSGEVLLGVRGDQVDRAAQVAAAVPGARVLARRPDGVLVAPDPGAGTAPLVTALVGAGVDVGSVVPQRHLEEVFLELVAAAS